MRITHTGAVNSRGRLFNEMKANSAICLRVIVSGPPISISHEVVILQIKCRNFSFLLLVRHEVAISTVILEFQEITLRSAVSTLPRHASPATAGCEALGII
jgi:hypothetical protein